MKFILLNSNDDAPFAALSDNDKITIHQSSDFILNQKDNTIKKPDYLIQCLKKISDENNIKDIDAISVTTGPGSFTGIRVGIAIAKGLAAGLEKKIIPVNNFELTLNRISNIGSEKKYCILIPAKLPEFYYSIIQNGINIKKGTLLISGLADIIEKDTVIVSNFDNESQIKHSYFNVINVENLKSEPESMLELTKKLFIRGKALEPTLVEPDYMKDFNIKKI